MSDAKCLCSAIDLSEHNLGIIKPLSVKEVIKLESIKINDDLTKFHEFLLPFIIDDKLYDTSKIFNCAHFEDEQVQSFLAGLIESLKILYRTVEVKISADISNNININISDAIVNQSNYTFLCEMVKEMFFICNQVEENRVFQVAEANKAILEEYLRLEKQHQEEMAELNKKNKKSLHQIVTIVASDCLWDYDKVLNMTYYRLMNSYMSIFKIDNYETYMQYVTSGQFDMKNQNQEYWMDVVGK